MISLQKIVISFPSIIRASLKLSIAFFMTPLVAESVEVQRPNVVVILSDDTLQYLWCVERKWKLLIRHHGKDTTKYRNVHVWDDVPVRLYDLQNDPGEKRELSSEYPDIVERLRAKIMRWHSMTNG